MFVHKSIISDEILDYANNNDGFYLAQITRTINEDPYSDVSKKPMIVNGDITNIEVSPNFANYAEIYVGVREIADRFSHYESKYKARYKFWESNPANRFESGEQEGSGELWFAIGDYCQFDSEHITGNNYIILTLDNNSKFKIYMPCDFSWEFNSGALFWVAEDGSLYWANTLHSVDWYEVSPQASMDSYYALRHADELANYNIAKSALDGLRDVTDDEDATSIAVNNGSVDFISDGTTCTDYDDNGTPTIPEDDYPNVIDDTITFNSQEDKYTETLDIGYHYDTNQDNKGGLYHPSQTVTGASILFYGEVNPTFVSAEVNAPHHFSIASGKNSNAGLPDDLTMLVYGSQEVDGYHDEYDLDEDGNIDIYDMGRLILYQWYESPEKNGEIDRFLLSSVGGHNALPDYYNTAMTSVKKGDDYEGTIYAGVVVVYDDFPSADEIVGAHLKVYRYNPDDDTWTTLYTKFVENTVNIRRRYINDMALVAKDEDLWVFWTYNDTNWNGGDVQHYIMGKKIADAATITTEVTGAGYQVVYLNAIGGYAPSPYLEPQLDADWDDATGSSSTPLPCPRITWFDTINGNKNIISSRVTRDPYTDEPNGISNRENIEESTGVITPCISVNDYNRSLYSSTIEDVFLNWYKDSTGKNRTTTIDVEGASDTYDNESDITSFVFSSTNDTDSPDITYRGFGTPRYIYFKGNATPTCFATNTEILSTNYCLYSYGRITTSDRNLTDVFAAYNTDTNEIEIKHIDP